jgi:lysine biosynthesis protein LysW
MASRKWKNGKIANCPACGSDILFHKNPKVGRLVTCRICDSLLEVINNAPLELEWAFEDSLDDYYRTRHRVAEDSDDWDLDDYDDYLPDDMDDDSTLSIGGYS